MENKTRVNVTLCGRPGTSCCPVLSEEEDGNFQLVDDYNGKVTLTKAELLLLKEAIEQQVK